MIRMFVDGEEVVYGPKDIVIFVFEDADKELIASMAESASCLAIYDPDTNERDKVAEAITTVKQICAVNPLSRA